MWVLLTKHCQNDLCGLFHHINSENNYATPALFLTASGGLIVQIPSALVMKRSEGHTGFAPCVGQLHVQMKGESGESAFTSTFQVPLSKCCQISIVIQGATVSWHVCSLSHQV